MPLLHGVLDVYVHEATDLASTRRIQVVGCMKRYICCGALPSLSGSCDPYLCLDVGSTRRLRTRFIEATHNPVWNERFEVYLADEAETFKLWVKDADVVGADFLGQAIIPVSEVIKGQLFDQWLELTDQTGAPVQSKDIAGVLQPSRVHISLQFRPVLPDGTVLQRRDAPATAYNQVPRTYFPMRPGNRVTLYHDSTCIPGPVDGITLAGGGLYSESSCWDDLYDAIMQAERFIWITGWSVWVNTMLKRTPMADHNSPHLGELLKQKADEGVKVLMLVWDDKSNNYPLPIAGVMGTHDNETHAYFKGTNVVCVLCPRQGGTEDSYLQAQVRGNMFTHHQKTVIVDAPMHPEPYEGQARLHSAPALHQARSLAQHGSRAHRQAPSSGGGGVVEPSRRLVAFVGGLDLTEGRYDTHDHPLFATRQPGGPHEHDTYQGCLAGLNAAAPYPREPWHDIHARVEGPVAVDVAINFLERWSKQTSLRYRTDATVEIDWKGVLLPTSLKLLDSKRETLHNKGHVQLKVQAVQQVEPTLELPDLGMEGWNVQLFRSIDSNSADGFPTSSEGSFEAGLSAGKGKSIDASIHRAYIELIRGAKRYLYLENQYFLGSAHLWDSDTDTPCFNQVPAEIALKIVSKIQANEDFRVYVVIPMFPEGIPTSQSVQAILYYQAKTRQMMYRRIADALEKAGLKGKRHPQDYLQFFCLGKRESNDMYWGGAPAAAGAGTAASAPATNGTSSHPFEIEGPAPDKLDAANGVNGVNGTGVDDSALPDASGGTPQEKATAAKRFMIYVHSKLMIVDDEYIVVGSANINQRSLDGTRDSEICIGAFQPAHTLQHQALGPLPQGQVAGFRRVLWKEHLGALPPAVEDPSTLDCMAALTDMGKRNWAAYIHPTANQPLPYGHLLTYPTPVDENGFVSALAGSEDFPDLGGRILGQTSGVLPPILTT